MDSVALQAEPSPENLKQLYREFSRDEIQNRLPGGENLQDVYSRVKRFFDQQSQLLEKRGMFLIVGHRNVNKMIIKHLAGLTFEQGYQLEHLHQQIYLFFGESKTLWSYHLSGSLSHLNPMEFDQ